VGSNAARIQSQAITPKAGAGRPAPALGVMACDWILAALLPTADPAAVAAERDALLSLRPYSGLAINFFW